MNCNMMHKFLVGICMLLVNRIGIVVRKYLYSPFANNLGAWRPIVLCISILDSWVPLNVRGLLEKYPTFGREKETGLLGALDT